jgi:hypothetical protein
MFLDKNKGDENHGCDDLGHGYSVNVLRYLGYSYCRCCEYQRNGDGCYLIHHQKSNTTLAFPQGFLHYIVEHNVHPDFKTIRFIMKMPIAIFIEIIAKLEYVPKFQEKIPMESVSSFKDALLKRQHNEQPEKVVVVTQKTKPQFVVPIEVFDFDDGLHQMISLYEKEKRKT